MDTATAEMPPESHMPHEPAKPEKLLAAVELGRRGGLRGGRARASKLTPEQRAGIAKKAAEAGWGRQRANPTGENS